MYCAWSCGGNAHASKIVHRMQMQVSFLDIDAVVYQLAKIAIKNISL